MLISGDVQTFTSDLSPEFVNLPGIWKSIGGLLPRGTIYTISTSIRCYVLVNTGHRLCISMQATGTCLPIGRNINEKDIPHDYEEQLVLF